MRNFTTDSRQGLEGMSKQAHDCEGHVAAKMQLQDSSLLQKEPKNRRMKKRRSTERSNASADPTTPCTPTENALRASEERFARFMGHLSDAAWMKDVNGHYIYANTTAEGFFPRPPRDLLGATDKDLFPVEVVARLAENERLAQLNGTHTTVEVIRQGGVTHYYNIRVFTIRGYDGQPGFLGGIANDITERRRHDAALSLMASMVESSEDAIISEDLNGIILSWNPAAQRILGYTAEEVIGSPSAILMPDDRHDEENRTLEKLRNGERVEHLETARVCKDGKRIDVLVTISPIRHAGGTVVGTSHIASDITDRKHFDEKLRQTAKLESLGILAGGVAHDFNNLLTVILGNASLCLDSLSPANRARPLIKHTAEAAEKAAYLTRQLLAYAGKGRFVVQPVNLSDVVNEIRALVRASVPKTVQLRLDLQEGLPCVEADIAHIHQLIINLIINGAEAIPEGTAGTVLVSTSAQEIDTAYIRETLLEGEITSGQYAVLEVRDTGVGMDETTASRIFEPFFSTKFAGRGLGLAAALGIIRTHKGAMKVDSTPGKGTIIRVLLPAAGRRTTEAPPETLSMPVLEVRDPV